MALIFLVLFHGLVSLAEAQSGDGSSGGFVLDEVGLALIVLGGFIALVLCIGWLWFCWRLLCLQKNHAKEMKAQNKNYERQVAQARRQRAMMVEQRNIRRAVENSLNENGDVDFNDGHHLTDPPADNEHNDLTAVNLSHDDNDDSWFFDIEENKTKTTPNKQQALATQIEEQDVRPPSFNSLQPLQQSSLSHTPPVSQQRRMLNTFTHLPQVTPNQEQYDEDIDHWSEQTQPQRDREPGYDMGMRPTNRNEDRQRTRIDQHQQMPQYHNTVITPQQDVETDSSSDDETSSEDDGVNIDDIINQHMSGMPTIGMINTGNNMDTRQHPANPSMPTSHTTGEQPGHFQRFDPVSRIPIHSRRRDHNHTTLQQHPLSYSQTSNSGFLY